MKHGQRNEILSATNNSLTLRIDGREEIVPWSIVTGVSAGRAKLDRVSEHWVLVLAFEAELQGQARLFIVGEIEPAWVPLTTNLHIALPDIEPFEVWGAKLINASAPMELYQRGIHS